MGQVKLNVDTIRGSHPETTGVTYKLRLHRAAGAGEIPTTEYALGTTEAARQDWRDLADAGGSPWVSAITGLIGATTWGILDSDERADLRDAIRGKG